jgi:structure-specific recognition protein 1
LNFKSITQFQEQAAGDDEVLVEMKLLIPQSEDGEDQAPMWHTDVLKNTSNKGSNTGESIADLDIDKCYFLTPRGKYGLEMYKDSFRMKGKTYDYNVKYEHITQIFLLPMNGDQHTCVVISLRNPIRQGKQV